jgi:ABC-type multidrug transport system ATPase subunit
LHVAGIVEIRTLLNALADAGRTIVVSSRLLSEVEATVALSGKCLRESILIDIVRASVYYVEQRQRKDSQMSTYLELSKSAQEEILATIKHGQALALAGVELWAAAVASLTNGQQHSIPFETPAPKDVVANSFGFAEQLLASQEKFAEQIVAASVPVFAAAVPTSN